MFSAFFAYTIHDNVIEIDLETECFFQFLLHRKKDILIIIDGLAAFTADQVMMMSLFGVMINCFVLRLAFINAVVLFQQLKRTVDSRLVHLRELTVYMVNYIFSRYVTFIIMYIVQDQAARQR